MPRQGQIIPRWLHPTEEVYINDNTFYEDYTDDVTGPRFLCVFVGGKGRGDLLLKRSIGAFVEEYGYPDYRRWKQAMYIPYTALFSGYAQCQCLCLKAADSSYANLILAVGYKAEDGKMKMQFKLFTRTNIRNLDDLEVYAGTLERTTPDEDGYKWVPIMYFYSLGKGSYGEDFCIRLVHDKNGDKDNAYKNYNIQVLSAENGGARIESYNVTFDQDSKDPNTDVTLFCEDIVNDVGAKGSSRIGMKFFIDHYQTLFDFYCNVYKEGGYVPPTQVDVDRLPSVNAPSTVALYHLTEADGSYSAGAMYVYDAVAGTYNTSSYTITDVTTLPAIADASADVIYNLTADDGAYTAGKYIVSNGSWIDAPEIIDVAYLPSTTIAQTGIVYHLTKARDSYAADTLWTFDAATEAFVEYVEPEHPEKDDNPYTIGTWDMFGYNRFTKEDDEFIEVVGPIDLFDLEGVALQEGSDGSFADDVDSATREAAIERAYINAFQGTTDAKILSKRRAPVDIVLDAGFSLNIKKAIVSMVTQREDCVARLDTGLLNNIHDVYDMAANLLSINTYLVSKDCGMFKTSDPITGKVIPVTITLWMAAQYPTHYRQYGNHVPMAGENYAVISGYQKNSIKPEIDADDHEVKEKLYADYQMNYIECLDEDTWVRGTQLTSQQDWSDLSEENNVLVLLEIKRKIERLCAQRRYKWSDEAELRLFQDACDQYFSSYRGTKCKSLSIRVAMSDWEKIRYIVHVYLEVVFRTFQKRAIIEIDVNPRV